MNFTPQMIQQAALQLTDDDRLKLAMDLLESLPASNTMLSLDDPDLEEKLLQRGDDAEGSMTWEQMRNSMDLD